MLAQVSSNVSYDTFGGSQKNKPFQFSATDLVNIIGSNHSSPKHALSNYGGIETIANGLKVNLKQGLNSNNEEDLNLRKKTFGVNFIPPKKQRTILELMMDALQDMTLQILLLSGVVSLTLSLTVGEDPTTGWMEGAGILVAVTIVTLVTAANDYQKEKQFRALNAVKEDETVKVLRDGFPQEIKKHSLLVGDILRIDIGDILSADGIVFDENQLKVDESSMTGESQLIGKDSKLHPFLLSGTKVMEGVGKMLVVAVGPNSQAGVISQLISGRQPLKNKDTSSTDNGLETIHIDEQTNLLQEHSIEERISNAASDIVEDDDDDASPLQGKLNTLTLFIGKGGILVSSLMLVAMVLRFTVEHFIINNDKWEPRFLGEYLNMFIVAVTVLVVAIPEGLPLAVTLSLAYSVKKMLSDNNLVRHLDACETMGSATTICSDKTGTLTTNRMTVMRSWADNQVFLPAPSKKLSDQFLNVLCQGICVNSTADILEPKELHGLPEHSGSKTECALLQFSEKLGVPYRQQRGCALIEKVFTFSSDRKRMSTLIRLNSSSSSSSSSPLSSQRPSYRMYTKGASEMVLRLCTNMVGLDGTVVPMPDSLQQKVTRSVINNFSGDGLRTLCLAYRDLDENEVHLSQDELEKDLTCIMIVGIEDPVRPEVPKAIEECRGAGITVRMVTGDNRGTACAIAKQCGIIRPGDNSLVLEGKEFRSRVLDKNGKIIQTEFDRIWPELKVLARSSPQDKYVLVSGLMATKLFPYGPQVVAVTGDGTNDAPALKCAHVGFSMGISGTSVAKDASDIILMDDNLNSIVQAVKWGRNVYDSISKFLQFQLTVNVVAIVIAASGAILLADSPLTAIQLLWINIIMDAFASLALATEPPTPELLQRKPYSRDSPLISKKMTKHIFGQAIYQLIILFTLIFAGDRILGIPNGKLSDNGHPSVHYTMVFNTFVWMQLFNEINARKIHDELNIFDGLMNNTIFLTIAFFQVVTQILIVQYGGIVFGTTSLSLKQWFYCILLGFGSLPVGFVLRLISTKTLPSWLALFSTRSSLVSTTRGQELWVRAFRRIRVQLHVVKHFKRGLSIE